MRARRIGVLVAVAALVAGCGDGGDGGEVTTAPSLDLASAIDAMGSARWAMSVEAETGPTDDDHVPVTMRMEAEMEGVVDHGRDRLDAAGSYRMSVVPPEGAVDEPAPPFALRFEVRRDGEREWSRSWSDGQEPGGWRLDEAVEDEPEPEDDEGMGTSDDGDDPDLLTSLDPTELEPVELVETLRELVGDLAEDGTDEVDGVAVTRYVGSVDLGEVDDEGLWPDGATRGEVVVLVDGQGRLRRLEAGGYLLRIWDFGVEVAVEEPTDVLGEDEDDLPFSTPELTGDWAEESSGTVDGVEWTVVAAPAEVDGEPVTCRAFFVGGVPEAEVGEDDPFGPTYRGQPASCGTGGLGAFGFGRPTSDPALQVLPGDWSYGDDGTAPLAALVVSPRFPGPVRLVGVDGEEVEAELDGAGIAVVAITGPVAAVELDGGAVRCEAATDEEDLDESGFGAAFTLAYGLAPCVRT